MLILLQDAGWYNINATEVQNDGYSRLVPSYTLWPSNVDNVGFTPMANLVHSMSLKFGFRIPPPFSNSATFSETLS